MNNEMASLKDAQGLSPAQRDVVDELCSVYDHAATRNAEPPSDFVSLPLPSVCDIHRSWKSQSSIVAEPVIDTAGPVFGSDCCGC